MPLKLYGRKLWETMRSHWPTADRQPGPPVGVARCLSATMALSSCEVFAAKCTTKGNGNFQFRDRHGRGVFGHDAGTHGTCVDSHDGDAQGRDRDQSGQEHSGPTDTKLHRSYLPQVRCAKLPSAWRRVIGDFPIPIGCVKIRAWRSSSVTALVHMLKAASKAHLMPFRSPIRSTCRPMPVPLRVTGGAVGGHNVDRVVRQPVRRRGAAH